MVKNSKVYEGIFYGMTKSAFVAPAIDNVLNFGALNGWEKAGVGALVGGGLLGAGYGLRGVGRGVKKLFSRYMINFVNNG